MPCNELLTIWAGNTFVVEVNGLKFATSGSFANAATVTISVADGKGVAVAGTTWPRTLTYVSGSDGIYRGTIPATAELKIGKSYYYVGSAEQGGAVARWEGDLKVTARPLTSA